MSTSTHTESRVDGQVVQANVRRAIEQARAGMKAAAEADEQPSAIQQVSGQATLQLGNGRDHRDGQRAKWLGQAARVASLIEKQNAAYFAEPTIQFPLAVLERNRKRPRQSDVIVQSFLNETGTAWGRVAANEVWILQPSTAAPGAVVLCHRTAQAPYLDGHLDDVCWQRALRVPLLTELQHHQSNARNSEPELGRAEVQLAYDDGFLYLAADLPRREGVEVSPVEQPGRTDDAELLGQDRLSLQLDVDRDYATCYRIAVDQRGATSDACWENESWNAQRFVAVDADESSWRIEMAIPFTELAAQPPRRGETWAAGLMRVLPTVGVESWTLPAGSAPQPEGFGLLRFE